MSNNFIILYIKKFLNFVYLATLNFIIFPLFIIES